MAQKMLIDATHPEETRVVVVDGNKVEEFDFESINKRQLAGNIYLAKVTRVEPSLQAAFVDYGGNRHGFLAFAEIHPDYYQIPVADRERLIEEQAAEAQAEESENEARDEAPARKPTKRRRRGGKSKSRTAPVAEPVAEDVATEQEADAGVATLTEGTEAKAEPSPEPAAPDSETMAEASEADAAGTEPAPELAPEPPLETIPAVETVNETEPEAEEPIDAPAAEQGDEPQALESAVSATEPGASEEPSVAAADPADADTQDEADPKEQKPGPDSIAESAGIPEDERITGEADDQTEMASAAEAPSTLTARPSQIDEEPVQDTDAEAAQANAAKGDPIAEASPSVADEDGSVDMSDPDPTSFDESDPDGSEPSEPDAPAAADTDEQDAATDEQVESVGAEDIAEEIVTRRPSMRRYKIQEVIKVRQILLVQVVKEERGNKGAALTTYLSLPGRYCVLMPNTARGGGISRKITAAADRKKLREIATELEVPKGAGLIIRTAGSERTKAEIKRDYDYLIRQWDEIRNLTLKSVAPTLIYEEGSLIKRAIRDYYNRNIDEILVEGEQGHIEARNYMKMLMPSHARNVKRYDDPIPLFSRFQAESYLASMFNPVVQLKSGGYIVIGVTEALVAIDINSGRSTREHSIEETALKTNLEAADEIARQLRLRDLAGLVVIDFIDMEERRNNSAVEKRLKDRLKSDRARIQIGRISAFGLLEMSRQRLRPGILETITSPCPHCHGTGLIRSDESLALTILRELEDEGVRQRAREVLATAPVGVANYLMNQKREALTRIEQRYGIPVRVECDPGLISPDYKIERFKTASRVIPVSETTAPITVDSAVDVEDIAETEELDDAELAVAGSDPETAENTSSGRKRRRRRRRRGGTGSDIRDEEAAEALDTSAAVEDAGEAAADLPAAEAEEPVEVSEGSENPFAPAVTVDEPSVPEKAPRRRRSRKKPVDSGAAESMAVIGEATDMAAPREIDSSSPLGPIEMTEEAPAALQGEPASETVAETQSVPPAKPKVRRRQPRKTAAEKRAEVEAAAAQAEAKAQEGAQANSDADEAESDLAAGQAATTELSSTSEEATPVEESTAQADLATSDGEAEPVAETADAEAPQATAEDADPVAAEADPEPVAEPAPQETVSEPPASPKPKRRGWWSLGRG